MSSGLAGEVTRAATTRRKGRIIALQVLFEVDRTRQVPARVLARRLQEESLSPSVQTFIAGLVEGVLENQAEIDMIISKFAPTWPINQLAVVDRNILREAIFEIKMGGETPPRVAINEAVELSKVFGSESSPKFVNGVLGSVMETEKMGSKP